MNVAVLGLFSQGNQELNGSMVLMISHGFVSAGMFLLIGILYDRHHSRLIGHYSGIAQTMPVYAILFIIFSLANIGFPLSYNYVGEISIVVGIMSKHFIYALLVGVGVLLSVVYAM